MEATVRYIENALQRDLHSNVLVSPFGANLSAYLAGAFALYDVRILDSSIIIAELLERNLDASSIIKRTAVLSKQLGSDVVLYLSEITADQRRRFFENGQGFITKNGDYYIPTMGLLFSELKNTLRRENSEFTPTQQSIFLHGLFSNSEYILQSEIQHKLGWSTGSISNALSLFVDLRILDLVVGGKTGRQKRYFIPDKREYYLKGIEWFGSPVKDRILVPENLKTSDWLKSGLSSLAERSDLLPPTRPVYAVSAKTALKFNEIAAEGENYCGVQVLKYDPAPFAINGCVDPFTMLLTVDDEDDERVSLALSEAMKGYEWYQA